MSIKVKTIQDYSRPITVTVREDGFIMFCNHAGAGVEAVITSCFDNDSGMLVPDDSEYRVVCDKCPAQKIETDEGGLWIQ